MTSTPDARHVSLLWAGPDRAADIARLHGELFDPPWDEASVLTLLEHPAATAFVASAGAPPMVAGFIMSQLAADEAEILSLGVIPSMQRNGIGAQLVEGLCRSLRRAEIKRLFLEVSDDNRAARMLYAKLGFAEIGRRKAYYQRAAGQTADAINLSLAL